MHADRDARVHPRLVLHQACPFRPCDGDTVVRQLNVLLVEDNPRDVRLIERAFRQAGFRHHLHIVQDGEEALAYLNQEGAYQDPEGAPRPDLILLDLNLPRLSGHEVLQHCKQHDSLKQLPIVVLTTSAHPEDIRRAYAEGANAYLLKPIEFSRFTDVMRLLSTFWLDTIELPPEL